MHNTTKFILKGDKSISHRLVILGSICESDTIIENLSNCDDVLSTINCLKDCGAKINFINNKCIIKKSKLVDPKVDLNCGNSGTTARLLIGLLSGQGINANFIGDESLKKRPMDRVLRPLSNMELKFESNNMKLPIKIFKSQLNAINISLNVPSAQVKSSLIFAGLGLKNRTTIKDPFSTRDHTEKLIEYLEANSDTANFLTGFNYCVPGDISNAAFLIAAGLMLKKTKFHFKNVLFNKTRMGFVDSLIEMGAKIEICNIIKKYNEKTCDIIVSCSNDLRGVVLDSDRVVKMIDEIPIFSIIACFANGRTIIKGVNELRYKESDRVRSIYDNLSNMGADISLRDSEIIINGGNKLYNTTINHFNDHRILMAFEVLSLYLNKKLPDYNSLVRISFPDFYKHLNKIIL